MTPAEIETLRSILGASAVAITNSLHEFAVVLDRHTETFNGWAASQEEILERLARIEKQLADRGRPRRGKPRLEVVK